MDSFGEVKEKREKRAFWNDDKPLSIKSGKKKTTIVNDINKNSPIFHFSIRVTDL